MKAYTHMVLSELIEQAHKGLMGAAGLSNLYYYRGRHDALTEVDLMISNDAREMRELLDKELQKNKDLNARLDGQKTIIHEQEALIANVQRDMKIYRIGDRFSSENIKALKGEIAELRGLLSYFAS